MAVERFINPFLLVIPAPDGINKREVCQISFFFFSLDSYSILGSRAGSNREWKRIWRIKI